MVISNPLLTWRWNDTSVQLRELHHRGQRLILWAIHLQRHGEATDHVRQITDYQLWNPPRENRKPMAATPSKNGCVGLEAFALLYFIIALPTYHTKGHLICKHTCYLARVIFYSTWLNSYHIFTVYTKIWETSTAVQSVTVPFISQFFTLPSL